MAKPNLQKLQAEAADFHRGGNFEQAEKRYREILFHAPNMAEMHNARGAALASLKRPKEAAEAFGRATVLEPNNEKFHYNYGNVLKEQGLFPKAIEQFLEVVRIQPHHLVARIQLGLLYQQEKQWREAMEQFNHVCTLKPDMVEAFEQLGYCLLQLWRYVDAEGVFRRALQISPSSLLAYQGLARALMGLNRATEAAEWIRKALLLYPNLIALQIGLGRALVESGNQQEAIALFESIIKSNPEDLEAYRELAAVKKFRPEDEPFISRMEKLLEGPSLSQNDLVMTHFSLGKMCDDIGQYDRAFHFYNKGNHIHINERQILFTSEANHKSVSAMLSSYSATFFANHAAMGHDSEQPVFVVGMPRSGTTLTEQILSSHPQVAGAGEVNFWISSSVMLPIELSTQMSYPECVELLHHQVAVQIAEKYLATLQQLIANVPALRIVDKMPQNFNFLGLIATIFPKAKIIHIQRDAMDTCLSIYFQNFKEGHPYSYDLVKLGNYYKEYERIMQHWREVLPIKMLEIKYEELVADQERVTREMIDYIGVPWDERCLQPEKAKNVVRTASLWQARQPVYKTSVARWKHYEKYLQPLKEALGYTEK